MTETAYQPSLELDPEASDLDAMKMAAEMEARAKVRADLGSLTQGPWTMPSSGVASLSNGTLTTTGGGSTSALAAYTPVIRTEVISYPVAEDGLTPVDFVIWLNGVLDVDNLEAPTPEQWARIRDRLTGQVAGIARHRLSSRGVYKPFT